MILVSGLSLRYGTRDIFDNVSFSLKRGMSLGLVGRNGAGKSTLLRILAGYEKADSGSISIENGKKMAYLPQEVVLTSDRTVFDEAFAVFDELDRDLEELKKLEALIEKGELYEIDDIERYAALHERLANADKHAALKQTLLVLSGLGFDEFKQKQSVSELSTGWKMRLVLAKLLLQKADFYCFDEPTNHLDIVAKDWFLKFLKSDVKSYLLVTHDRYFLDHACNEVLEVENGEITWYKGNYSQYVEQKDAERERLVQASKLQQRDIERKEELIAKFKAKASKAAFARSLQRKLDDMEVIEIPPVLPTVHFSFAGVEQSGAHPLRIKNLAMQFGDKKLFSGVECEIQRGEKVALVAANGVGKSTLMNILADKLKPTVGEFAWGYNTKMAYFEQDQLLALDQNKTILEEITANCARVSESEMRRMLGCFLFSGDDVHKKIRVLSGGEQNRVAMVKVLLQKSNFLLLDEPTNHLDLFIKHVLLQALTQYTGTLLFVSHDQDFLSKLATRIIELTPQGLRDYKGNYDYYLWSKEKEAKEDAARLASQPEVKQVQKKHEVATSHAKINYEKELAALDKKIKHLEGALAQKAHQLEGHTYGTQPFVAITAELELMQKQLTELNGEWDLLFEAQSSQEK
ncbi:ABC-F family ATP-binding cassette domain-containing protein [Candidatus Dependentiae bacterium]|nr:ABC-F family ATP-binding cassette domain-containing protein [Candidatus Dependentiae bacterium]